MALYSKKEFAELCGMRANLITIYEKRGKIVVEDGMIDTEHEKNRAFYQKNKKKKTTSVDVNIADPILEKEVVPEISEKLPPKKKKVIVSEDDIPDFDESEKKLKYLDTLKREREVELLKLREEKLKGLVVPSELVTPIFLQHNQSLMTEFKNGAEELIRLFAKKKDLSGSDVADLRKSLVSIINSTIEKAATATKISVESVIKDYSNKRAVGER